MTLDYVIGVGGTASVMWIYAYWLFVMEMKSCVVLLISFVGNKAQQSKSVCFDHKVWN
jgi:hypothetical protein